MKYETLTDLYCPWRNSTCIGENCIACQTNDSYNPPEDVDGELIYTCIKMEEIRLKLIKGED